MQAMIKQSIKEIEESLQTETGFGFSDESLGNNLTIRTQRLSLSGLHGLLAIDKVLKELSLVNGASDSIATQDVKDLIKREFEKGGVTLCQ